MTLASWTPLSSSLPKLLSTSCTLSPILFLIDFSNSKAEFDSCAVETYKREICSVLKKKQNNKTHKHLLSLNLLLTLVFTLMYTTSSSLPRGKSWYSLWFFPLSSYLIIFIQTLIILVRPFFLIYKKLKISI